MKINYIIILIACIIFFVAISNGSKKSNWIFTKITDKTIYFSNGNTFEIELFNLKYIGKLQTKNKAPYLILSGRTCEECDENISIYIHSPSDGLMNQATSVSKYSYPGRVYDYVDNKKLISETRMFYGNCLDKNTDSVVWVQKQLNSSEKFEDSIYVLEVNGDKLEEKVLEYDSLLVEGIINSCDELPGMDFFSEP